MTCPPIIHQAARYAMLCGGLLMLLLNSQVQAFSGLISPPRFEDQTQAGKTYRNIIEISNVSDRPMAFSVKTNDWTLDATGGAVFSEALAADSCRPWVGIEASSIQLPANGKRRYRFEVAVPAGTPAQQCRFALMFEGEPEVMAGSQGIPVAGRIGVIVYLNINGATADLQLLDIGVQQQNNQLTPVLKIANRGLAHGRLEGMVDAIDATGQRFSLAPVNDPILPNTERVIALYPIEPKYRDPSTSERQMAYPLTLKGKLDWQGKPLTIDTTIAP